MLISSTDDAQLHCLKITEPKLVIVDAGMATQLGKLSSQLKAKGITAPLYCWSTVRHLEPEVQRNVKEIGDAKTSDKDVQDVINGVGTEQLGPDSDGIVFFTSG